MKWVTETSNLTFSSARSLQGGIPLTEVTGVDDLLRVKSKRYRLIKIDCPTSNQP